MARYNVEHRTLYHYTYPVSVSHHAARLKPVSNRFQSCESFHLDLQPACADLIERKDYFDNVMHLFSVQESHASLTVDSCSNVFVKPEVLALEQCLATPAELSRDLDDPRSGLPPEVTEFTFATPLTPSSDAAEAFGSRFVEPDKPIGEALAGMLDAFKDEFEFDPEATEISTPIDEVLASRRGVCQDFAHVMLAALRASGLSARYVSGYILNRPSGGGPQLLGADASHAWVSVFTPENGWVEVDPTNRLVCSDQHIRVAYGRDFSDVSMITGAVTGGGEHSIEVAVTVTPVEG